MVGVFFGVLLLWGCGRVYLPHAWTIPPVNHAPVNRTEMVVGARAGVPSIQYEGDKAIGAGVWCSYAFSTRLVHVNMSLIASGGRYQPATEPSGFNYAVVGATSFVGLSPVIYPLVLEVVIHSGLFYDHEPTIDLGAILPVWGLGVGIGFIDTTVHFSWNIRYVFLGPGGGLTTSLQIKGITFLGGTQIAFLQNGFNGWVGIGYAFPLGLKPRTARLE